MKTLYSMLAGLFTLVLLTACGGGGGSAATSITGNAGLGTTVTTGVAITALNAPNVAAAVLNGITAVTGSSDGAASAPPLITGVAVNTSSGNFGLPGILLDQLVRVPALQNAGSNGIVGAAVSLNVPCTNGGSASVFANIADPAFNVLSVGDTLGVTFFLCNELGVVVDGALDMIVSAIQGSTTFDGLPPFNVTFDATFNALRALDGSEYYYADGDMQQVLVESATGDNINAIMSGTSLDTSYNNQYPLSTAYHDQRLTAYLFDVSGNDDPLSVNFGNYSIDLDGTVTFTTTQPGTAAFTGNEFVGNGDPTTGILLIQSNFGGLSQLWLNAQPDGVSVILEVDIDGDDIIDTTIPTTWAALEAL